MDSQFNTPVQAENKGSGKPLPLVSDRLKPKAYGEVAGTTPKALFLLFHRIFCVFYK